MAKGDLHIHTLASDGLLSPSQVVDRVKEAGLGFFSIADHNTTAGIEEAEAALAGGRPRMIYGVELSAQPKDGDEIHVLGYGFDPNSEALREACRRIVRRKNEQMWRMVRRLRQFGVGIEVADLPTDEEDGYVGRPLLAERLVRRGVVHSTRQAFVRFLGSEGGAYVPMREFSPGRCIEAIHEAGGLAVLAHPTIGLVDAWIDRLADRGLDGAEAYRPGRRGNQQLYIEKAAEHFGLFVTGGSDFHGRRGDDRVGKFTVRRDRLDGFFSALAARTHAGAPKPD